LYNMSRIPKFTTSIQSHPRAVSGRTLAHCKLSPFQRGCVGADLATGELAFELPTVTQAAYLARASRTYVRAATKLTPFKRRLIISGADHPLVANLIAASRPTHALPAPDSRWRLIAAAKELGLDTALEILASMETAPVAKQAAE
jgi:hypothetical protein